jgi:hypothetical protein
MGFEELFNQDRRNDRMGNSDRYRQNDFRRNDDLNRQNDDAQMSSFSEQPGDIKQQFLDKLRDNPQLKTLVIAGAIIVAVVVIILAVILIPVILKLFGYVGENGIQGLINTIWKGTK